MVDDDDFKESPLHRVPPELWDVVKKIAHHIYPDDPAYGIDYLTRALEVPVANYGEKEFEDGFADGTCDAFDFVQSGVPEHDSELGEEIPLSEEFWSDGDDDQDDDEDA